MDLIKIYIYADRRSSQWETWNQFGSFNQVLEIKARDLITWNILSCRPHIKGWYLAGYLPWKFGFVKNLTNFSFWWQLGAREVMDGYSGSPTNIDHE